MLPPLWGREGVTFVFFLSQQKDEQNQVFSRAQRVFLENREIP
jgi:hypothetical protein